LEFTNRWPEINRALLNSIVISLGATLVAITFGTLAGYGLARFRFYGWQNKDITMWFLSQRFLPPMVTVIPFFLVMQFLDLLDTRLALILTNATFTMPFAVLIMRDVFKELPIEMEESAWVDGPITVIIAGVSHTQGIQFWFVATRLLFAILPPTLLALTAQRYIVRGLTFGAVKG
ncbi:MAG: carbohydrate ABC transporter permease, partial [Anaerolineae bacterium]